MPTSSTSRKLSWPKDRRIRRRQDFVRIQATGARIGAAHFLFVIAARPTPSGPKARPERTAPARVGIVTSRKAGNAVRRNRIRRLLREAFRRHAGELPEGCDVVVIARSGAHELSFAEVEAELLRALPRLAHRARTLAPTA